ncbi:MAG: tRNA lysidine(34) synthetase TilS [Lachnospiraceae bacterium]|jgi:tRNA(Ile)-lysidine synthase|nr:tRNA lysidine(34) synthetase TilS [Lachnospiraceae bacterium]
MVRKILETIKREELMRAGELVVTGVSGGADSICLLSVLLELKRQLGIRVAAVHVHHGIRGAEADGDEAFVREFCESRQVPFLAYYRDVPKLAREKKITMEEAGRQARYQCFKEAIKELSGDRLAVAHNRDDNAETVLFHLFRGSGLKGLSGMDYQAPIPSCGSGVLPVSEYGRLVRPLLDISRKEIETYLFRRGISYCQDSTNISEVYDRNRIRLNILPEARRINEEAISNIVRAAGIAKEAERWMEKEAEEWIKKEAVFGGEKIRLPGKILSEQEPILAGLILRKVLERLTGSLRDIAKRHTDQILELAGKETGRRLSLPGEIRVQNEYGMLVFSGRPAAKEALVSKEERMIHPTEEWKEEEFFGRRFRFRCFRRRPGQKIPENRYTKWFACDKIKGNLSLRGRRSGDWFQAFAGGGRQSVKSYMINEKIPADERGKIPLLAEGSHVLWIVDGRISEAYKVTEESGLVLEIKVSEA